MADRYWEADEAARRRRAPSTSSRPIAPEDLPPEAPRSGDRIWVAPGKFADVGAVYGGGDDGWQIGTVGYYSEKMDVVRFPPQDRGEARGWTVVGLPDAPPKLEGPTAVAFIYQAAFWCEDDGMRIRWELDRAGKSPDDPSDDSSFDSDDYPKGPEDNGGGDADTAQFCDAGEECINAVTLPSGGKIGQWLDNPLTDDGLKSVCEMVRTPAIDPNASAHARDMGAFLAEAYESELRDAGCLSTEIQEGGSGLYVMAVSDDADTIIKWIGIAGPFRDVETATLHADEQLEEQGGVDGVIVIDAANLRLAEDGIGTIFWQDGERLYPAGPGQARLPGVAERRRRAQESAYRFDAPTPREQGLVHLQGIGDVPGKPAGELVPGDITIWNYGYRELVDSIEDISPAYVEVTIISEDKGERHFRRMKKDRLVAVSTRAWEGP